MLCKPASALPEGDDWSFEIKFDGYRCEVVKTGAEVRLHSRNEKSLNARFPALVEAFGRIPGDFVVDGEVVALDGKGKPSFGLLQNSAQTPESSIQFYAFDLLYAHAASLLTVPLADRRASLATMLTGVEEPIRLSPVLFGTAGEVMDAVRKLGLEGVVAKAPDSVYEPDERSGAWVKFRTSPGQEFVIGGYEPGAGGFESLLVGTYEGRQLLYAGMLRAGFVRRDREEVSPQLEKLATAECPFADLPEPKGRARWGQGMTAERMADCRWVRPRLVCQAEFVEWTSGGRIRHPKFVGMREDKVAAQVIRES